MQTHADAPDPPARGRPAGRPTVLVVDDEPDVLESTCLLVEGLGYRAIRVSDPALILDVVAKEKPNLLLQDLRMPGLNVAGLVAALRLNPDTAELPVVFFSAGGDLPTTAARYDAWGYLGKPFGKEELANLLSQVLGAAPNPVGSRPEPDLQRKVRAVFHDYWNLLAALSNYILILDEVAGLPPEAQKSVNGLDELILKLESKTDRLNTYIMSIVQSVEPVTPPGFGNDSLAGR